ncbi:unnamed protein product [Allacma fusca]|uniref:Uncharacterized protein n=1 Tax=Allacma fusca TaxID=39272 RepID=A0A8J2KX98_9HEXA|nr:unnamed protein product [Allacma fusca]
MKNLFILFSIITVVVVLQHQPIGAAVEPGDNARYFCCSCCGYDIYCNRNSKGGISMEKSEKKTEPFSLNEFEKSGNSRHSCCSCCGYTTSCNRLSSIISLSQ